MPYTQHNSEATQALRQMQATLERAREKILGACVEGEAYIMPPGEMDALEKAFSDFRSKVLAHRVDG